MFYEAFKQVKTSIAQIHNFKPCGILKRRDRYVLVVMKYVAFLQFRIFSFSFMLLFTNGFPLLVSESELLIVQM